MPEKHGKGKLRGDSPRANSKPFKKPSAGERGSQPKRPLDGAQAYAKKGFSVIPIKADGSKAPACEWKEYQETPPSAARLKTWFGDGDCGLGIVCGAVSGGLTVLDFDDRQTFRAWKRILKGVAPKLLNTLPIVETPTGGAHVYFRSDHQVRNGKLARRRAKKGQGKTLIETRGEGGYVIAPGSPAGCHPSGKVYCLTSKTPVEKTPTLAEDEAVLLVKLARSFDETAEPAPEPRAGAQEGRGRPGDRFNREAEWADLLEPHGWKPVYSHGDVHYWRRPGKKYGVSATTGYCHGDTTGDRLYVFSSNAEPFEDGASYSKFGALALLDHGGDFKKAASAINSDRAKTVATSAPAPRTPVSPISLAECINVYKKWLPDIDTDAIELVLGVLAGNDLAGDRAWLFIVGPPSSGKTELLRPIMEVDAVIAVSTLTTNTLISGFEQDSGEETSLLPRLHGKTLVIKDFTPILGMGSEKRGEIFGQLRDAYDGDSSKAFGTGAQKNFQAKFNLIAATTSEIERKSAALQPLGERFLRFRPRLGDDYERVMHAAQSSNSEPDMRRELAEAAAGVLAQLPQRAPKVPPGIRQQLADLAQFLAAGRTYVHRDRNKDLQVTPEVEGGARIVKQLIRLAQGVAILNGRDSLTEHEVRIAARVVAGSLPSKVRVVLMALASRPNTKRNISSIARESELPKSTLEFVLQDLILLRILERFKVPYEATVRGRKKKLEEYRYKITSTYLDAAILM